eukprot:TRINITY_DN1186_c2_g4_i1.p1 TRINITY_DN1186_c2_g4~~TRINITY_DN1186_c2_g4_i1.p1  ORF type:complete len:578 (+),score=103.06 TRINITY_DN1186_c2_g4_i1:90-1736(+)
MSDLPNCCIDDPYSPTISVTRHSLNFASDSVNQEVVMCEVPTWLLAAEPEANFRLGKDAVIFVLDCTKLGADYLMGLDDILGYWLQVARYHSTPEAVFLIAGTKDDLCSSPRSSSSRKKLEEQLQALKLPYLMGNSSKQAFGTEVIKKVLSLRATNRQTGGIRAGLPVLAPLPAFTLPLLSAPKSFSPLKNDPGTAEEVLEEKSKPLPSQVDISAEEQSKNTPAKSSSSRSWSIPRGDIAYVGGANANLDGPSSGAHLGRLGRSPSRCALLRGQTTVVAKEVDYRFLKERIGSDDETLKKLLSFLVAADCPQLANFFGVCFEPSSDAANSVILITEYMPGGDLERYLRSHRSRDEPWRPWVPPSKQIFKWAVATAKALFFLHGHDPPIPHGNLKPSNLLLDSNLEIKLSTAGILSPVVDKHAFDPGEPRLEDCLYSAPEVLIGQEYTAAADIYAFGLMLWFMCTGARPLADLDNDGRLPPPEHVLKAFRDGDPPKPPLKMVSQGRVAQNIIKELWAKEAGDRPAASSLPERLELAQRSASDPKCCCVM